MDHNDFKTLARLTIRARNIVKIDSSRLIKDKEYAEGIFKQIEEVGNEELLVLAITLRQSLGMMGKPAEVISEANTSETDKYRFGARN